MSIGTYTLPHDRMTLKPAKEAGRWLVYLIRNFAVVVGPPALLLVDIIAGPWFLSGKNTAGSWQITAVFWGISLGMIAIQMLFWDFALRSMRTRSLLHWQTALPIAGALTAMFIDAMFDVGFVTQLLYPAADNSQIIAANRDFLWWLLTLAICCIGVISEPLILWMYREDEYEPPRAPVELYDENEYLNDRSGIPGEQL